ncbi:hypothetical protein N3K63_01160 [Microbacterium sp. W1N]|uniref:hypothetical protein n=1 Tax=Microbacterium festucae TaxID=2977531 RepID=UPI0021BE446A|nr:hypothetical protein [Microbacterium festucae]MCT9818887.1 hypothetical protein [Microbacterium festucae]
MSPAPPQWQVDIPFDGTHFLEVPVDARSGDAAARAAWVAETTERWNHAAAWSGDGDGVRTRVAGQVSLLSGDAFAAFLFCPRGLPGDALVEVFIVDVDARTLDDIDATERVALPQRVRPFTSPHLGEGRVISSAGALDGGAMIGQLRYQFLASGVFVETAITSADLGMLGSGMELFDALASDISVIRRERTGAA